MGDPWLDDRPAAPSAWRATSATDADYSGMGFNDVRQMQSQVIRQQDEGLDQLSTVLSRQKQMAIDIGNEVEQHNDIIDDIHDHVDRTHDRLIRETRNIKVVDRKSGTCGLWVVIVLLFIAIVIIAVIPHNGKP